MKAVLGYLFAGLGIIGLAINSKIAREALGFLDSIGSAIILIPSAILIVIGIVIMIMNSKTSGKFRQITDEVPIYRGEGRKRKIVAYRTEK
jgi:uncharacterized membrane protein